MTKTRKARPAASKRTFWVHVKIEGAALFHDYYLDATDWDTAAREALRRFKDSLPTAQKSLIRYASAQDDSRVLFCKSI